MDVCKKETEKRLRNNGVLFDELYMRKTDDVRRDSIIKEELYNEHIKDKYNVNMVFDDRPQVIRMWRGL